MKRKLLLWSLVLNLALAMVALGLIARAGSTPLPATATPQQEPVSAAVIDRMTVTSTAPALVILTNRFHWRQLESDDYDVYLANLRAAGCPERTVRDILLADVRAHFERRRAELSKQGPFWLAGRKRREQVRSTALELRRIEEEERELIARLLNFEWPGDNAWLPEMNLAEQAIMRFVIGPVPDETVQRILSTLARFDRQSELLRERMQGIFTDEDELEMARLDQRRDAALRETLTAAQFEELIARGVAVELFDSRPAAAMSEEEARRIALARAGESATGFLWGASEFETPEEAALREARFTNEVAAILGGPRFEEYLRAQDEDFRRLYHFAAEHHLPNENAVQVYQARRLVAEEVGRIRADNALDEAARAERLREMETEVQRRVSEVLGSAYQEYLNSHGSWLTNMHSL